MKAHFILKILILSICFGNLAKATPLREGGWSGNGGNTGLEQDNIWFLGNEPIRYCVINQNSAFTKPAVELLVKKQVEKWKSFFAKYQMNQFNFSNEIEELKNKRDAFVTLDFVPSNDCVEVEKKCLGVVSTSEACHQAVQDKVLFLIGAENSVVQDFLKMGGKRYGAAIRTDYNHQTYRSGGIIWIHSSKAKDWSEFSHLLLHEIGHIFGMKHDSCWVMASDVALLGKWNLVGHKESIESPTWPFSYKIGDELLLTDPRFKVREDFPAGTIGNFQLGTDVLQVLGFQLDQAFRVTAKILDTQIDSQNLKIEVTFVEYPSLQKRTLVGDIVGADFITYKNFLPQVYSEYISNPAYYDEFETKYLTSGWISNQLSGILYLGNLPVFMRLERSRGLKTEIHFSGTSQVLRLSTVQPSVDSKNLYIRRNNH